ncbi:hypothetical protein M6D81_03820 [Paenibacillus sp. J5C_2022]|uniref:hypothetical protein n=1 Tax=Paenibacillus sp. J5C2022 TaxID=2977129 RepID=UPI0021D23E9F|nr:hypothetical protein [Paenibacillus sp. J5C2022]MCU6707830.1 hypothetical protein [Paenibacillus sp. J5C2022]
MNKVMYEEDMLLRTIRAKEADYNEEICMLRSPFNSPGYHTTIKKADSIHSTLLSLVYALGLLDTKQTQYEQRACDIMERVIAMQDTDRSRSTFGIWPWFYEEPLDRMSPPDWNWADFCGKQMVLAELRHGDRLPVGLRDAVRKAVANACDAIMLRDVGPEYTNIAIMGAFVTLIAGEVYERESYRSYGMERLKKLADYTRQRGAFQEYNSPAYTCVAIVELSKIAAATRSPEAREIGMELLNMAWKSVGDYYHPATGQWSGPHSRSYQTLLKDQTKAFLQLATDGALLFFPWEELPYNEEWYGCGIKCPEEHIGAFLASETREIRQIYEVGGNKEKLAATYMTPVYTLGSFSDEMMWNQRRVLLAYVDNGGEATYAHLRFLHDGYDYCSAVFHSAQAEGHVLFGIGFLKEGGDTHPNLDRMNGSIEASDFRLRLEIGGCQERVSAATRGSGADIAIDGTTLLLRTWHAAFGRLLADADGIDERHTGKARPWGWDINRSDGKLNIDFIIHSGARTVLDFHKLERAALLFSLMMNEGPELELQSEFLPEIMNDGEFAAVRGSWKGQQMALSVPLYPVGR